MESTRNKLIELLEKNKMNYISGQQLSNELNISRTAVWKHMKELEKDGYMIKAVPRKGYQITKSPNKISENTLHWGLHTNWLAKDLVRKVSVPSTQIIGHQLAADDANHGTVIIADEQTRGKGRMNRTWHSAKDQGIWMSIILRPKIPPVHAPQITLLAATVLADVISEFDLKPLIKWPNDVYLNNKKVAGILTEMRAEQDQINYLILGIGINVNNSIQFFPDDIKEIATSLKIETGQTFDLRHLIQRILESFELTYDRFTMDGFPFIKQKWENYGYKLGEKVVLHTFNKQEEVTLVGIEADGALIVKHNDNSVETVYSAEIKW